MGPWRIPRAEYAAPITRGDSMNQFTQIYNSQDYKQGNPKYFPYLVDIELTNHCNLRCIFCGQREMTRPKGYMDEKIFRAIIDECAAYNTPVRLIRWGEPFMHPLILEYIRYAKGRGLPVHVTTNGLAFRGERHIMETIDTGLDSIIFSFQGATAEGYKKMRGGDYASLCSNIMWMAALKDDTPHIHISSTMTDETEEQIQVFINHWSEIVDSVGVGKTNLALTGMADTIEKEYRPCLEVYRKLSVDWDGRVTCCCGDYDCFMQVGDISETLHAVWHGDRLREFRSLLGRDMHRSLTLCRNCYHTYEEF